MIMWFKKWLRFCYLCWFGPWPSEKDVVECLILMEKSGRELRWELRKRGFYMNGPAFYQFMHHLEKKGVVYGYYKNVTTDDKERFYSLPR